MAVTLSDKAATHIGNFIAKRGKGVGIRLGVRTSGCSGMAYKLEFVDELAALLVSGGKGSDARQQDLAQAITQKIKISHDTPPSRSDMAWCHVSYHQA